MRIVSLLASATEIVSALGARDELVGISHECDFPPGIESLPACSAPKIDVNGTSFEIDQRVKSVVEQGLSVYRVDADRLKELAPDVIVTQAQCEVCAVSEDDLRDMLETWVGHRPDMVTLIPNELVDVWTDIANVARAIGREAEGRALVEKSKARMDEIVARAADLARPSVVLVEWIEPPMAAGNWMPELVELAGGENLLSTPKAHSPWISFEDIAAADPDVILVLPCGFDMDEAEREMPALTRHDGWCELKAVRDNQVVICDGNQYFNRPGPRLVESLEILAEVLHPETFSFGHEGSGWRRYAG